MANPLRGKATSTTFSTETPEAGAHAAVLVGIIDKGTHTEEVKDEKTGKVQNKDLRKILLVWELTDAPMSGTTNNHVVYREYSLSYHKMGKLRQLAESLRGKPYGDDEPIEYDRMLGIGCLVGLKHKTAAASGRTYAVVDTVSKPMKGQVIPPAKHKPTLWFLDDDDLRNVSYDLIPSWVPFREGLISEIKASHQIAGKRTGGQPPQAAARPDPARQEYAGAAVGDGQDSDEIPF